MVVNKKSQSALEFLMTYGWAILAVVVTIAGLAYFGVLDISYLVPESCRIFHGVSCTDWEVYQENDNITLTIRNGLGQVIRFDKVNVTSGGCTGAQIKNNALPGIIGIGEQVNLVLTGCTELETGKLQSDLIFEYEIGNSGIIHTAIGEISVGIPVPTTTSTSTTTSSTTTVPILSTFNAIADSYVTEAFGTRGTNYGTQTTMKLMGTSEVFEKKSMFIKFNVNGVSGSVTNVKLRIRTINGCTGTTGNPCLSIYGTGNSWTETGVTWSNQPTQGSLIISRNSVSSNVWYEFDVTSYVAGNGDVSFVVKTNNQDESTWRTRETIYDPQLKVSWA